ncbi:MAG: hypothetical protein AAGA08_19465 [Pseudomonadota bacterium]
MKEVPQQFRFACPLLNACAYRNSWFHLLAAVYGTTRSIIEQCELRRRAQNTVFVAVLVISLDTASYLLRELSLQNTAPELAADAEALSDMHSYSKLQKSLEALETRDVDEARISVRNAISSHLEYFEQVYWHPSNNSTISGDKNFGRILIVWPFGGARVWDTSSNQMLDACGHHGILEIARL